MNLYRVIVCFFCINVGFKWVSNAQSTAGFSDYFELSSEQVLKGDLLSGAMEIDFNSKGELYILDRQQLAIIVYDQELVERNRFGQKGSGPGEFRRPIDLYIGEDDIVYVLDVGLRRISIFSASGDFLNSYIVEKPYMDLVEIDDYLCAHTGAIVPLADDNTVQCFNKLNGKAEVDFLPPTLAIAGKMLSYSNASFSTIQTTGQLLVALSHPLDGKVRIVNSEGKVQQIFKIDNAIFKQPEIPDSYNIQSHNIKDYATSMIHGIYVAKGMLIAVYVELGTGIKYVDLFDLEGNRKLEKPIRFEKRYPVYADENGALYSFSYTEDKEGLKLKKYRYKGRIGK
ncbi:MAG: hypothetical protein FH748_02315 [Balneolaceae bacterium]|nr:hypothetical protein [Balneolaceae bacterium]